MVLEYHRATRYLTRLTLLGMLFLSAPPARSQVSAGAHLVFAGLDGQNRRLSDYLKVGPVYLSFWALWCTPCKQELVALKSIVRNHPDGRFTILAVNQDTPRSLAKIKAYVSSQKFPFPVVLDPETQIFRVFGGQVLPLGILLNREGAVVLTRTGYLPGDEKDIEREILSLLETGE